MNATNETAALEPNGYLLLFRNTDWAESTASPEEFEAIMDRINAWFGQLEKEGKIAAAQPLLDRGKTVSGKGGRSVKDGPYAESKEAIGGYVLLKTTSEDEALAIARGNPMLDYGLVIEVRPTSAVCPKAHRVSHRFASVG